MEISRGGFLFDAPRLSSFSSSFFFSFFHGPRLRSRDCIQEGSSNDDYESPIRVIAASWDSVKSRESLPRRLCRSSSFGEQRGRIRYGEYRDPKTEGPGFSRRKWKINMYSPTLQCLVTSSRPTVTRIPIRPSRVFKLNVPDEESMLVACLVSRLRPHSPVSTRFVSS